LYGFAVCVDFYTAEVCAKTVLHSRLSVTFHPAASAL